MKKRCPICDSKSITLLRLLRAVPASPTSCTECDEMYQLIWTGKFRKASLEKPDAKIEAARER